MTDSRFNKGIQDLKKLSMTASERRAIFERVTAAPLPVHAVRSPWSIYSFNSWVMNHRIVSIGFAAVLAVILGGGGLASAAMKSLPGDSLYPIKVNVVEPARVALAPTPVAKAEVQAELADTRLSEAVALAQEGKLDDAKKTELATRIDAHTEALNQALDQVSQNSPEEADDISNSFEASARAHVLALQDATGETGASASTETAQHPMTMSASFAPATTPAPTTGAATPTPSASRAVPMMAKMSVMMATTASSTSVAATEATSSIASSTSVSADSIVQAVDASLDRLRVRARRFKNATSTNSTIATTTIQINGQTIESTSTATSSTIKIEATSSGTTNGSVEVNIESNGKPVQTIIQKGNGSAVIEVHQQIQASSSVNLNR